MNSITMRDNLYTTSALRITERDGERYISSLEVANVLPRRHDNLCTMIRGLLSKGHLPSNWFVASHVLNPQNGQMYSAFDITEDGAQFLTLWLRGREVVERFKLQLDQTFKQKSQAVATVPEIEIQPSLDHCNTAMAIFERLNLAPSALQAVAVQLYGKAGIDLPAPVVSERHYSTTDLGKEFGIHAIPLGKLVSRLKIPEYGERRLSTAPHGKQIEVWAWNAAGREAVKRRLDQKISF